MKLEELVIYQTSNELSDKVWKLIVQWDSFSKEAIGKDLLRAVDGVALNIAIGFGRYSRRDTKTYGYYSRGSLFATKTLLQKAAIRNLINEDDLNLLLSEIETLEVKLNNYIKSIGRSKGSSNYKSYNKNNESKSEYNEDVEFDMED